ncbi:unnamed protein product [Urochloa decumbens]|uniref:Uncharacterized protein n=1 Tax=Urochloa decumbens TaxID=240449 RepID=A0ABC9APD8_9POAL
MADFAIGISKKAVEALANKVKSAIKEEAELWQTVQRDMVFIADEFEMMQSFLNTADKERIKNSVVKTWVRQVHDLSYEAEDCIDFILHLNSTKQTWWLRLLPSCNCMSIEPVLPLDKAVAEIKLLKARVEDVSQRNMRYNLINDSGSKPVMELQQTAAASTRKLDILIQANDAAKKQSNFLDLARLIAIENKGLQVISVCGTGGDLGTISITKEAYDNPEVCQNFGSRAWVKLTHPFDHHEFMRSLWTQFHERAIIDADVLKRMEATQSAALIKEFVGQVKSKKYLLVLEDLSNMAEWLAVRMYLPDMMKGSRIIVLTRLLEIASSCVGHPYHVLELKHYSNNHSVCAFFNKVLQHHQLGSRDGRALLRREATSTVKRVRLTGRSWEALKLEALILDHDVVSVWGMAGVGKSALLRSVYQDCVDQEWFDVYGWVNVSNTFNLMSFCQSMVLNIYSEYTVSDTVDQCRYLLGRYKCLLVIDGLQSTEDWDQINTNLICGTSRCCVVVITTEESVAKHAATSHDALLKVIGLAEDDAALNLFTEVLHREAGNKVNVDMIQDANKLLAKCGGLPKVIVALATYLAHLQTGQRGTRAGWSRLHGNFMHELETNIKFSSLRSLFSHMHSSYHTRPLLVKKCILYLSIFSHEKSIIRRRRLVRRWMAEGYSKGTSSSSLEDDAEKLVAKLADVGVIWGPQTTTGASNLKIMYYQINCLFLDYIISQKLEDSIFLPLEVTILQDKCRPSTGHIGQHLAIRSSWETDKYVYDSFDFSRLRSLTVSGRWQSFFITEKMRVLRVLDLEGTSGVKVDDIKQIGDLLPRLKFLSLRGCKEVSRLPDSLGDLRQLQTLDIRGTSIITLPRSISKLKKLQYIRVGAAIPLMHEDYYMAVEERPRSSNNPEFKWRSRGLVSSCNGVKVPRGIVRHLEDLQTLGTVNINAQCGEYVLFDIIFLHQLKKLQLSGINQKNSRLLYRALRRSSHLESLTLQFEETNNLVRWGRVFFPNKLQSLKLYGNVDDLLAEEVSGLPNLTKLSLEMTILFATKVMMALGSLQSLHTLRLGVMNGQHSELQFSSVLKLQVLEIACKSSLHVKFNKETMSKLEQLKVHCSDGSTMKFYGLQNLISLKQVDLLGSSSVTFEEELRQQLAEHPKKPALKLYKRSA